MATIVQRVRKVMEETPKPKATPSKKAKGTAGVSANPLSMPAVVVDPLPTGIKVHHGGSSAKGTAVRGQADVDVVLIIPGLRDKEHIAELKPALLARLRTVFPELPSSTEHPDTPYGMAMLRHDDTAAVAAATAASGLT